MLYTFKCRLNSLIIMNNNYFPQFTCCLYYSLQVLLKLNLNRITCLSCHRSLSLYVEINSLVSSSYNICVPHNPTRRDYNGYDEQRVSSGVLTGLVTIESFIFASFLLFTKVAKINSTVQYSRIISF